MDTGIRAPPYSRCMREPTATADGQAQQVFVQLVYIMCPGEYKICALSVQIINMLL